jgi:hypothetical protein
MAGGRTRRAFLAAAAGLLSAAAGKAHATEADVLHAAEKPIRWLAFYGVTAEEATLATYDIVVLDHGFQGAIGLVASPTTRVCGYVSLGEIRTSDPFMPFLDRAALLPENPDWPGTHRIDVRHPSWHSLVLDRQIPSLVSQGFTGLMFDTLDTPPYLEQLDPARYHGMREAAVGLVDSIRKRWPEMMLIMNRGYALLPDVIDKVDAVIAESLMTSPDQTGGFAWLDRVQVELQLKLLEPAARRHPPLPVLSLDYWDPKDARTIAEIYRRQRALGHHPYVATRSLDQIVPEQS